MIKSILLKSVVILVVLCFPFLSYSQSAKEKKKAERLEQYNEMKKLIESKNFHFEANKAIPQGMSPMDLIPNENFANILDSIADFDMPFFGRAFVADYGQEGGIEFKGKMEDVKTTPNDKKLSMVFQFRVTGEKDTYRVIIEVNYGGSATLSINSNNRSFISYYGDVMPSKKEEE